MITSRLRWRPGSQAITLWVGEVGQLALGERIEPHLKTGNGAVSGEQVVAGRSSSLPGRRRVGAGLASPEILHGLRCVENVVRIDVGEDRADFRIGSDRSVAGSEANQKNSAGERKLHGGGRIVVVGKSAEIEGSLSASSGQEDLPLGSWRLPAVSSSVA